jgi:hypothetical protein
VEGEQLDTAAVGLFLCLQGVKVRA